MSSREHEAIAAERRFETPRGRWRQRDSFSLFSSSSRCFSFEERPAPGSTAAQIADFYLRHDAGRVALVGVYLVPFAGIAFLWFIAAIRSPSRRTQRIGSSPPSSSAAACCS